MPSLDLTSRELKLEKSQYAAYEVALVKNGEYKSADKSIQGVINNVNIPINVADNIISFVLPNLNDGNYKLVFTDDKDNYHIPLNIVNKKNLQNSDIYLKKIEDQINNNLTAIYATINTLSQDTNEKNDIIKSNADKYKALLKDYKTQYLSLSEDEKKEFAKCITANDSIINTISSFNSLLNENTKNLRQAQTVRDYDSEVEITMTEYVGTVTYTIAHIPFILMSAKIAAATLDPYTKAGATLALGFIVMNFIVNVDRTLTLRGVLLDKSLRPFEDLSVSQSVYRIRQSTAVLIEAKYRSLFKGDDNDNNNGSTIKNFIGSMKTFDISYKKLIDKLPPKFQPNYIIQELRTNFITKRRQVHNKYIRIKNVTNSNVQLSKIDLPDGNIEILAQTSATSDQDFSYDIEYSNSNLTNNFSNTIKAKLVVKELDSIAIYKAACVGKWTVNHTPDNNPSLAYTLELKSDGTGTYTIPNPTPQYPRTTFPVIWTVDKLGKEYRMYEEGFWNHDPRRFARRAPLTYPVKSFIVKLLDKDHIQYTYIKN